MSADADGPWRARFERERRARKEAEALLDTKSRELWESHQALEERARELASSLERLQEAQEALIVREKMAALGGLVAGVAHEINTPLGIALTATTHAEEQLAALRREMESGQLTRGRLRGVLEQLDEAATLARTNLARGASLIQSFKLVAADQSQEEGREAHLAALVADVLASVRPVLRQARVEARSEGPPDLRLHLAAGVLTQVLTNLVQNACVHAFPPDHPTRTVSIRFQDRGDHLLLQVSDDGVGMSPEVRARVFEPFFTTRRGVGGTGLGMHIVHNLVVETFQGDISCDTAPGAGTTWNLSLPYGTRALARVP